MKKTKPSRQTKSSRRRSAIALESRFMFDAAAVATGAEVLAQQVAAEQASAAMAAAQHAQPAHDGAAQQAPAPMEIQGGADRTVYGVHPDSAPEAAKAGPALWDALSALGAAGPRQGSEVVFVMSDVQDWQQLAAGIDPSARVLVLDAGRDGVAQMAEALAGMRDVGAVHIISHGSPGALALGTATLDAASIQGQYADELAAIGRAMTADGDILVYGCDFGAGDKGVKAEQLLANATHADIAASTNATGAAGLGGDWVLERQVGTVESTVAVSERTQAAWDQLLTTAVPISNGNIFASISQAIYSIDATTGNTVKITDIPQVVGGVPTMTALSTAGNSLATNTDNGLVYYMPTIASNGALFAYDMNTNSHVLVDNNIFAGTGAASPFPSGGVSSGATYYNGTYYISYTNGGVTGGGFIYAIKLAQDGRSVVSSSLFATVPTGLGNGGNGVPTDMIYLDNGTPNDTSDDILSVEVGGSSRALAAANNNTIRNYSVANPSSVSIVTDDSADQIFPANSRAAYVLTQTGMAFTGGNSDPAFPGETNPPPSLQQINPLTGDIIGNFIPLAGFPGIGLFNDFSTGAVANATIGDKVFVDADKDGTFDAGETGIAGATVQLVQDVNNDGVLQIDTNNNGVWDPGEDRVVATDTTDANGNYLFTGVNFGNYLVRVTAGVPAFSTTPTLRDVDITTFGQQSLINDFGYVGFPPVVDLNSTPTTSDQITNSEFTTDTSGWTLAPTSNTINNAPARVANVGGDPAVVWTTNVFSSDTGGGGPGTLTSSASIPAAGSGSSVLSFDVAWNNESATTDNGIAGVMVIRVGGTEVARITTGINNGTTATVTYSNGATGSALTIAASPAGTNLTGAVFTNLSIMLPGTVTGQLSFSYDSNGTSSFTGSDNIAVDNVHVVTTPADGDYNWNATYTENGPGVSIADTDSSVSDGDSANMVRGQIVLTNRQNGDFLSVGGTPVANGDIGSFNGISYTVVDDGTTITINLSGSATKAAYAAFIEAVTFANSTDNPVPAVVRDITVQVNDGAFDSNVAHAFITVTAVNDAPTQVVPGAQTTTEDTPITISGMSVNDPDGPAEQLTTTLSLPNANFGTLSATGANASYNASTGVLTLTGTAAQINAALATVQYTPTADFNTGNTPTGPFNITLSTSDGVAPAVTGTFQMNVTPVADTVNDTVTTPAGTPVNFNPITQAGETAGQDNFENANAVVTAITQPANGTAVLNSNGTITYTPPAGFVGTTTMTYTVTSGGVTETATITITVPNTPPVDGNETNTVTEDTTLTVGGPGQPGNLLANATDADGNPLTITTYTVPGVNGGAPIAAGTAAVIPNVGTLTINANGSYTFVPAPNYAGPIPVATYTVSDGQGGADTSTLTLTMVPVNDPPAGADATRTINEDATYTFAAADFGFTDPVEGNAFQAVVITTLPPAADGVLRLNGVAVTAGQVIPAGSIGQLSFVPATNRNGTGIGAFTFQVRDDGGTANGGIDTDPTANTFRFNITAVNDLPVDGNENVSTPEDTPISGNVLANASDVDGPAALRVTVFAVANVGNFTAGQTANIPGVGTLLLNSNGTYTFTPVPDYNGTVPLVTYQLTDGRDIDRSTLTITVTPVGDTVDDAVTTPAATPVTFNPITQAGETAGQDNFENANARVTAITQPGTGAAVLNSDGTITYMPPAGFTGTTTMTYTVTSGGVTETATITITVPNAAPTQAVPVAQTTTEDTAITITGLSITDPDGQTLTTTLTLANPAFGALSATGAGATYNAADGTLTLTGTAAQINAALATVQYTPTADFNTGNTPTGPFNITMSTSDGVAPAVTNTFQMNVTPVADTVNDAVTTPSGTAVTFNPITQAGETAGQDNFENANAVVTAITQPANGTAVLNANGTISYTPPAGFVGTTTMTYTVTSGGVTETATITITVSQPNRPPVDGNETATVTEDTTLTVGGQGQPGNLLANANDADGNPLTITTYTVPGVNGGAPIAAGTAADIPNVGRLTINADGSYTFEPALNYTGAIPVATYTVSDGQGGVDTSTLALTMQRVNDPPVVDLDGDNSTNPSTDTGAVRTYTAGTAFVSIADLDPRITDVDDTNMESARIVLTNAQPGDQLSFGTLPAGITGTVDTSVPGQITVTLTGSAALSTYQTAIRSVRYSSTLADPSFADTQNTRIVNVTVNDGDTNSNTAVSTINVVVTPAIEMPSQNVPEDTPTPLNFFAQTVVTPQQSLPVSLTLTVANPLGEAGGAGTLTASSTSTVTVSGSGTSSITLTGTAAEINAYLTNAATKPVYTQATPDYNGGGITFLATLTSNNGGDNERRNITITAVRDALNDTASTPEDTPRTFNILTGANEASGADSFENSGAAVTAINGGQLPTAASPLTVFDRDNPARVAGTVVVAADGTVTFIPAQDYNGTVATFSYTVTSGGRTETANVTITVTPVNDAPVNTAPATATTTEDTTVSIPGLSVSDVDGGTLTTTLTLADPAFGALSATGGTYDAATGRLTITGTAAQVNAALATVQYVPTRDFNTGNTPVGPFNITMVTNDGSGGPTATDTDIIVMTVTPVADITNDAVATTQAVPVSFNMVTGAGTTAGTPNADTFENATHPVTAVNGAAFTPGTPIAVFSALDPGVQAGTMVVAANGTATFTPDPTFTGQASFTYTVTAGGVTETATVTIDVAINQGPVANNDDGFTEEDQTLTVDAANGLLSNDTDPENDPLRVTEFTVAGQPPVTVPEGGSGSTTIPGVGTITIASDGSYTFEPAPDFNGPVPDINYGVVDTFGQVSEAILSITVNPVNDAPVDGDETVSTPEGSPVSGNVLANATDVDTGDVMTVTQFTLNIGGTPTTFAAGTTADIPNVGTLVINANGTYTFTPLPQYNGPVPVATYTVSDGTATDTSTLTITVTPVDDPNTITGLDNGPVAGTDAQVFESGLGTGTNPSSNGETATGTFTISSNDGLASLTVNGTVITAAQLAASGTTPITVPTPDGAITIRGYDAATGAVSYSFTLANRVDHSGGSVIESIALVVTDRDGDTGLGTLGVLIVDDAPVANADVDDVISRPGNPSSLAGGNVITGGENPAAPDPAGDGNRDTVGADGGVTVTAVGAGTAVPAGGVGTPITGAHGTLTLDAQGNYTYTPDFDDPAVAALQANQRLTDTFTYQITDADGSTSTTTLTITIRGVPAITSFNDGAVSGTDGSVYESDMATGTNAPGSREVLNGTFGAIVASDRTLTSITVGGTTITAAELANASTAPITVTTTYGAITIRGFDPATGMVSYRYELTTRADQSAGPVTDDIALEVTDNLLDHGNATMKIAVIDDAPLTQNDTNSVTEDAAPNTVSGNVLTNDAVGADTDTTPVTAVSAGTGAPAGGVGSSVTGTYGSLVLNADGTYAYTLDNSNPLVNALAAGQVVNDVFTYQVTDADGNTSTATLTIAITGRNDAPVDGDETNTTAEDTPLTVPAASGLLANTTDVDGGTPSVTQFVVNGTTVNVPAGGNGSTLIAGVGTITIGSNGSYSFTPAANFNGSVPVVTYTVSDGAGGTDTSTLALTVTPENDPPAATDDSFTMPEDGAPVTIPVLGNDSDPDGDPLTVTQIDGQTPTVGLPITLSDGSGTATLNPDGTITFTPAPNYNGSPVFTYQVKDPSGATSTATVRGTVTPVNDPPVDENESITTLEDTPATGNVLANSTDVDGGAPVVTQFTVGGQTLTAGQTATLPGVGTLVINADGSYTFTPAPNYNGPVPVATYTVSDGQGGTDTSTLTITVTPVNDLPVDGDESNTVTEDTTLTVPAGSGLLANTTDVDGGTPSVSSFTVGGVTVTVPAGGTGVTTIAGVGTLTIGSDGSYSFAPVANYTGLIPVVTYTVSDGNGGTDTSTLTLTMAPVNDPPVDENESITTLEDTPATGSVLTNATDVEGNPLTVTEFTVGGQTLTAGQTATLPGVGTLVINADGSYTFTPAPNYNGPVPVATYTVSDGQGGTDTSTLTISVTPENDPPAATDDSFTMPEDGAPVTIPVLGNDSDPDGDPLTVTQIDGQTPTVGLPITLSDGSGTATLNLDGTITFTPAPNYNGSPVFTYQVKDPSGATSTATVRGTVTPVNDAPVDGDETNTTAEDTPLTVPAASGLLANTTDVDGDTPSVTQFVVNGTTVNVPAGGNGSTLIAGVGTITIGSDGSYSFAPAANFNGSVPVVTYTVSDGQGGTDTSTLTISVTPVNDPPAATDDSFTMPEDGAPVTIPVLGNDSDPDGDPLTVTQIDGQTPTVGLPITLSDGSGTATLNPDGTITFTPAPNYNGSPVFTYQVKDPSGATSTATVRGTVTPVNDAPVDGDETNTTAEDTPLTVPAASGLLANTTDVDGDTPSVTQFVVNGTTVNVPAGGSGSTLIAGVGTITIGSDGSYSFTPAANFNGSVPVVTYTVSDGAGGTDTSTLTISVTPVNDPPAATDDSFTMPEDGAPVTIPVLGNDSDPDGDPLTVTQIDGQTPTVGLPITLSDGSGTATLNPDGTITFTPAPNYNGSPVFTYQVKDPSGATSTATVRGTVTPVNDPPVDADESITTPEDTPATGNVLLNSTDVDGGTRTVTEFTLNIGGTPTTFSAGQTATIPNVGTLVINADGGYTFTPAPNYNGPVPVATYTVSDGQGGTDTSTLTISVTPVNDPPVDENESVTTPEDAPVSGSVLANATDADGNPLTVIGFTLDTNADGTPETFTAGQTATIPNVGTLVINANGTYTFTPAPNYNGPVPVATYTVSDGTATDTSTLTISVTPVNDPPVDGDESNTVTEDTTLTVPASSGLLTNTTDVDGGPASVTQFSVGGVTVSVPAGGNGQTTITGVGTLTIGSDGSYSFAPVANYTGAIPVVTYTVSDGNGGTDTSTLTLTMAPVNDPPVDADESITTPEDTPATGNVLLNSTDVDGGTPVVTQFTVGGQTLTAGQTATLPGVGTLVINADGSYTFTPAPNYNGPVPVATYTVSDGQGGTDTSTLTISVTPVNDPPAATDDSFTMPEDGAPVTIPVLGNDSDPDGDPLTVTQIDGQTPTVGLPITLSDGSGTATLNPDGTITFTPAPNYNGSPVFTYQVKDPSGATSTATVRGTVTPVNDPPVDADESITTLEDTPATGNVLANSTDVDGGAPVVTQFTVGGQTLTAGQTATLPGVGTLVINADGSYTFTPAPNYNGPVPVATYTVSDGQGGTDTSTLTITVTPVNDPPAATDDSFTMPEDGAPVTIPVLGNDSDPDGDPLTVTQIDGQTPTVGLPITLSDGSGTATLNPDGTITFTPAPNYNGSPVFTYQVKDPSGATSTATVRGTVTPVNDPPVDADESITTLEDTPATGSVLTNATDVEGNPLTVTEFTVGGQTLTAGQTATLPGVGTLVINADGSYTFTPAPNYNGPVPVATYTVSDGQGGTDTSTLTISVTPVNDPPAATDDSFTMPEDGGPVTIPVLGNDSDPDGDPLTVTQIDGQTPTVGLPITLSDGSGTATLNPDGTITFTPAPNYNGSPVFTYQVKDPSGATSTATVRGTVTPVNDPPVDENESITTLEDTPATGNVLANSTDVDGGAPVVTQFTVGGQTLTAGQTATLPGVGTLVINADGSYTFTPAPNYNGPVPVATYTVSDGQGGTDTSTLTITVTPVNDLPVDGDESNTVTEDTTLTVPAGSGLLSNTTDVDGGTPSVSSFTVGGVTVTVPAGGNGVTTIAGVGTLTIGSDGSYSFAPVANYTGLIPVVTYTVSDGNGGTDTSTLTLTMAPVNDPPVDADESITTLEDTPATGNVLLNSTDVDGGAPVVTQFTVGGQTLTAGQTATLPGVGTLVINADGSYTFTPAPNYNGPVPVATYTVSDGAGGTDTSTLTISVTPVNDPPAATDDSFTMPEDGGPVTIPVLGNDSDPDGDPLTVTQIDGQTPTVGLPITLSDGSGTATLNPDGTITFTPAPNYNGSPVFTYQVKDPSGATSTATVRGTVTPVNDPPAATDDTFTVPENGTVKVPVLTNDGDPDGDPLTVTEINGQPVTPGTTVPVPNGTATLNPDGTISFTPNPGYEGPVTFTYTVKDPSGMPSTATVNGTVTPVNHPPAPVDDTFTVPENGTVKVPVLTNDGDPDGDPLTVTEINGQPVTPGTTVPVPNGTATLNPDGTISFTPNPGYEGPVTFTYTVKDPSGTPSTATVNGTVTPVNHPPAPVDDTFTVPENGTVKVPVLTNDGDPDGDPLTVTEINGQPVTPGTTVPVPNGTATLNPDGTISFTPNPGYEGPVTFTYTVKDPSGTPSTATVNGTVTPVNHPPEASSPPIRTPENTPVRGIVTARDPDGDPLTFELTHPPRNGSLTLNPDGSYTYTPNPGYNGPDSFTVLVSDGRGGTREVVVPVSVEGAGSPGVDIERILRGGYVAWPQGRDPQPFGDQPADARLPMHVQPFLNEAVNRIRPLHGTGSLTVPQPVIAAVNGVRSLDGLPDMSVDTPILDLVEHLEHRFRLLDSTQALFRGDGNGELVDVLHGGNTLVLAEKTDGEHPKAPAAPARAAMFSEQVVRQAGVAEREAATLVAALASLPELPASLAEETLR